MKLHKGMVYGLLCLGFSSFAPRIFAQNQMIRTERVEVRSEQIVNSIDGTTSKAEIIVSGKSSPSSIQRATIVSKGTNSIVVSVSSGENVTISVDDNTALRRRYWGKSVLDEFQIGDIVSIFGKWTDEEKTTASARFIRDWSIQKRNGVFFGTVTSVTEKGWVIETKRGNLTVTAGGQITNRRGDVIGKSDVINGHRIRVKGLWDRKLNTITEVSGVKDYSLPVKTTATPGV